MTAAIRRRELEEQQALRVGRIPVNKIRFRAGNRNLGDLRELAASLQQEGVLQPLLVHRIGDVHEVLDGHRRLAAARLAGLRTVPAMVVTQRSRGDAINIMVATAMHTKGLDPGERATAIRELIAHHGWSIDDLATRWGVSPATVARWRNADVEVVPSTPEPGTPSRAPKPTGFRHGRPPKTIGVRRVAELIGRWEARLETEFRRPGEMTELLNELRALVQTKAAA